MKSIQVPFFQNCANIDELHHELKQFPAHKIEQLSWPSYPYRPDVNFKIAHTPSSIYVEYEVKEKYLRAVYHNINDPVYRDSCVEFFISFDGERYYNFEFNSLGTALVGYGTKERATRTRLAADVIKTIKTKANIKKAKDRRDDNEWTLQIEIPLSIFASEKVNDLKGRQAMANFYKCGDDLPQPHYVSWNKIDAPEPNFHLPAYFGVLEFK